MLFWPRSIMRLMGVVLLGVGARASRAVFRALRGTQDGVRRFKRVGFLTPHSDPRGRGSKHARRMCSANSSKTSTVVGSFGESLASGTSSFGKCVTNVGCLIAIYVASVANCADDDLLQFRIRKIQHTVIAHTNAKPIAVLQFF